MSELWDIVVDAENRLGLAGPRGVPVWKSRAADVARLRRGLTSRPDVTTTDLRLALAFCSRRQEPITTITELFGKVKEARRHRIQDERPSQLSLTYREALRWEGDQNDADAELWLARLVRAFGPARENVLSEWRVAGRGPR